MQTFLSKSALLLAAVLTGAFLKTTKLLTKPDAKVSGGYSNDENLFHKSDFNASTTHIASM